MKYPFPHNKPLQVLTITFIIVMLMLLGVLLASFIVKLTLPIFFGIADATGFMSSPAEQIKAPTASLYMQVLTSSIGFFLLPAVLFHTFFRINIAARLGLDTFPPAKYWIVAVVTMVAAGIFIQVLVQLMQLIPLPASLQGLRSTGEMINKLLDSFFADKSPRHFVLLTIAMALMPAIGEEFFFRGTLQNILRDYHLSPIAAILISGFAFAAIHMEFDNTLGIWCMGVVLGLLYYYTGNLWVCITAHFLNNFMVVAGKFAFMAGSLQSDFLASESLPLYCTLPAGLVMAGGLVLLSQWSGKKLSLPAEATAATDTMA